MIVYFLRGLPGAGKSALANELLNVHADATIAWGDEEKAISIEADDYFIDENGEYNFDPGKLEEAHSYCRERYQKALHEHVNCIIVSNVSAEKKHVDWYKEEAELYGYMFISLIVENRDQRKSIHNVPAKSVQNMARKFDIQLGPTEY